MTWKQLHPQDQREIINLLKFKKRYKKWLTDQQKYDIMNTEKKRKVK